VKAKSLIRLYPWEWRQRYEEEMQAVLEQHDVTLATCFDLLFGAVDAHLNPKAWRQSMPSSPERLERLRIAAATPFAIFPLFFLIWFVVSRGDGSWRYLREIDPVASGVYGALYLGQSLGSELSLAFLAILTLEVWAAITLALSVVRTGKSDGRQLVLRLLPLAACVLIIVAALVRGKFDWLGTIVSMPLIVPPLIGFVISKATLNESTTRLLLAASTLAALAMIVTLLGVLILQVTAVAVLSTPAWPLQLVPGIIGIGLVAVFAFRALWVGSRGNLVSEQTQSAADRAD
jgi:hypothetical protein